MTPAEMLKMAGGAIGALFFIFYAYQVVYALVPLFAKAPARGEPGMRRYAVLIAARNEETVIARLIESIKDQDYPSELVSIFVVADNCTDSTAECARRAGAEVFERFDKVRAGKGYALSFLLARVHAEYGKEFDGYFVFDADNLLDRRYIGEMDRAFGPDCQIVTSCRNSKNYGDSWVSAGNALRFLYDSELLNRPRMLLGTACTVGGTGFSDHRWGIGDDLFERMIRLAREVMALNPGNEIKAFLWHQGETDVYGRMDSASYANLLGTLISEAQNRLNIAHVPFIAGNMVPGWMRANPKSYEIAESTRQLMESLPLGGYAESDGLDGNSAEDIIHFSRKSCAELGRRYFEIYLRESGGRKNT